FYFRCFVHLLMRAYLGRFIWFIVSSLFFFSSRRRHTRSYGDWSSDVCSSDLEFAKPVTRPLRYISAAEVLPVIVQILTEPGTNRSEERRVGKECRSRWSS